MSAPAMETEGHGGGGSAAAAAPATPGHATTLAQTEVKEAKAELKEAKVELEKAEAKLEKAKVELEKAEAKLEKAEAKLKAARGTDDEGSAKAYHAVVMRGVATAQDGVDTAQMVVTEATKRVLAAQRE